MGQQYKQLCMKDRCEIARRQRSGETCRQIAASMDTRHQALLEKSQRLISRVMQSHTTAVFLPF